MTLVDSSVWIDYFNGHANPETDFLDARLGVEPVGLGDIILAEVLQGFRNDADFTSAKEILAEFTIYEMLGTEPAILAAHRYRSLRQLGVTVRKTNDILIGSFCISSSLPLLFSDRDFQPMVQYLGLTSAMNTT